MHIQPKDVLYFIHDSASYMAPAARRLRDVLGYKHMVDVPCWGHILNLVGSTVFDQNLLPAFSEYIRLTRSVIVMQLCALSFILFTRLLFSRSPYWRTKWIQHQKDGVEKQAATGLRPGEQALPKPKSVVRGNDTRWDSGYDEAQYHLEYFAYVAPFYEQVRLYMQ